MSYSRSAGTDLPTGLVGGEGFEPPKAFPPADLQSAPFVRSGTRPATCDSRFVAARGQGEPVCAAAPPGIPPAPPRCCGPDPGRKQQGDRPLPGLLHQAVQGRPDLRPTKLFPVALTKILPPGRVVAEPTPKPVAGGQLPWPQVHARSVLTQPTGPQPVYQHPEPVLGIRRLVHSPHPDHGCIIPRALDRGA